MENPSKNHKGFILGFLRFWNWISGQKIVRYACLTSDTNRETGLMIPGKIYPSIDTQWIASSTRLSALQTTKTVDFSYFCQLFYSPRIPFFEINIGRTHVSGLWKYSGPNEAPRMCPPFGCAGEMNFFFVHPLSVQALNDEQHGETYTEMWLCISAVHSIGTSSRVPFELPFMALLLPRILPRVSEKMISNLWLNFYIYICFAVVSADVIA